MIMWCDYCGLHPAAGMATIFDTDTKEILTDIALCKKCKEAGE